FILSFINAYVWTLPSGRSDAIDFEYSGWIIASSSDSIIELFSMPFEFYRRFIGFIYYLFGRSPFLIQHISVITGTLLVYVTYKIVLEIYPSVKSAKLAAYCVAFYPGLAQFSAFTRRESLIYFFSSLSLVYCLRWFNKGKSSAIVKSFASILIGALFHSGVIFVAIPYLFFFIFYKPKYQKWNISLIKLIISAILIIFIFQFGGALFRKIPEISVEELGSTVARKAVGGRAGYLHGTQPKSWIDAIVQTPIRIVFFLFTPFPWQVTSITDIYGFLLDTVPIYVIVLYSVYEMKIMRKNRKNLFIFMTCFLLFAIIPYAWGTSNYGTAIRHRQKIVWLLIAFFSLGYNRRRAIKGRGVAKNRFSITKVRR
ncbi:MAG: glycosyltransferase family 39 protein, partial [Clostridium sp.]|uniref:glycosyltransferase family 39 protein n=1 Tax=Clostridium sp. TaxID=1506 RepID=UPI0025BE401E